MTPPLRVIALLVTVASLTACSQPDPGTFRVAAQESGTTGSLRGLSVVSDDVVWIGAQDGEVLRTHDGGETWQVSVASLADGADLRSAHGFSTDHALFITAGQPARILETRDRGNTFSLVWEDQTGAAFFDSLAFWDAERGIAFSDPVDGAFLVLRTLDGGASWHALDELPEPLPSEAGFAASNSSIALTASGCAFIGTGGGDRARVLRSCNYGDSWSAVDTPMATGSPGAGVFAVTSTPDGYLAVSGGDYQAPDESAGTFAISPDQGETWLATADQPLGYRSDIERLGSVWVAVGTNGIDLGEASDGSVRWSASGWGIVAPNAIAKSPSGRTAWIVGANGGIWRVTRE